MNDILLAEVTRGPTVESRHFGAAVLMRDASVVEAIGDVQRPVFPRSAIKPIQALQLIESGAADRYRLTDRELAIACASHSGETMHVRCAGAWLDALGLPVGALECGTHAPFSEAARTELAAERQAPCALHNNCSGKHVGFLSVAKHLGEPLGGYVAREHPTQARWLETLAEFSGESLDARLAGVDGCAIPSQPLSLGGLGNAAAKLATRKGVGPTRAAAIERIGRAMAAHPELVAGTGRACTKIMSATSGRVLAKTGAEGAYLAWIPEQRAAIVLKVADGATRAAEVAVAQLVRRLLGRGHPLSEMLAPLTTQALVTAAGAPCGVIRASTAISA